MADKQVTVAVPEDRVPEFYAWFAWFLAAEPGTAPPPRRRGRGARGLRHHAQPSAWSADDADQAAWLYGRLALPARKLFDLLMDAPEERVGGEQLAKRLGLEKGAHGVAGILAWPGRYSRHLDRQLPIATDGRADGGTDYYMPAEIATLFTAARAGAGAGAGADGSCGRRRRTPRD